MQTQVNAVMKTGREGKWAVQFYKPSDIAPYYQGTLSGFIAVKDAIKRYRSPDCIIRVIGPIDASAEELAELQTLGATQTFPPPSHR